MYYNGCVYILLQLDEINQLFLPCMRNKLLWFYQEVEEPEPSIPVETVSLFWRTDFKYTVSLKH
jgi:hypothetical protein